MTNTTKNTRTEEIIVRYPQLNEQLKRNLTDFYNNLIGLNLIAYGNENQREIALETVQTRISDGREAFEEDPLTTRIRAQVQSGESGFTQLDLEHIAEVTSLIAGVNAAAKQGKLDSAFARETYDQLIPYLYGRKSGGRK